MGPVLKLYCCTILGLVAFSSQVFGKTNKYPNSAGQIISNNKIITEDIYGQPNNYNYGYSSPQTYGNLYSNNDYIPTQSQDNNEKIFQEAPQEESTIERLSSGKFAFFDLISLIPTLIILSPLLLVGGLLMLLLPIITISIPPPLNKRSLSEFSSRMARDVLTSGECVERITCELGRVVRNYRADGLISMVMNKIPAVAVNNNIIRRASKTLMERNQPNCGVYACDPMASFKRAFNFSKN